MRPEAPELVEMVGCAGLDDVEIAELVTTLLRDSVLWPGS